ncbi:MAG: hypothetical protein SWE60_00910, partial [Thermodesulfobacteriota bacterium]|nr:hypothetical protein [Thermodesulfobacteriota bacterium]
MSKEIGGKMKLDFKRSIRMMCVLITAIALVSCGGAEEKRAKFFEKGKALYEKGEYTKARLE